MNLAFARTRTRVLDAMKSRGHIVVACHPDGNIAIPESVRATDLHPVPVGDATWGAKLKRSP
jgi:hypothetical protein